MVDLNALLIQNQTAFVNPFLQSIASIGAASFTVFLLSFSLAALGHRMARLLSWPNPSFATAIVYALSLIVFLGFYAAIGHFSVATVFTIIAVLSFFLLVFDVTRVFFLKNKRHKSPMSDYVTKNARPLWCILCVVFIFNLISLHSPIVATGVVGNNDMYYWMHNAGQFIMQSNMAHVLPLQQAWPSLPLPDAAGIGLLIGFFSVVFHSPVLAVSSLFLGAIISWIAIVMIELVTSLFALPRIFAVIAALIVICGVFFQYITYEFFGAQLCATLAFLSLLSVFFAMNTADEEVSVSQQSLRLFPLLALLAISYQAGFVPFFAAWVLYGFMLILGLATNRRNAVNVFKKLMAVMALTLVLAVLCYPTAAVYLLKRMLMTANAANGWPMSLLNVFTLFSIPYPFAINRGFDPLYGRVGLSLFSILVGLFTMMCLVRSLKQPSRRIEAAAYVFLLSVTLYLVVYAVNGAAYQTWKLASYIVMPISFIPIAIFAVWILEKLSRRMLYVVAIPLVLASSMLLMVMAYYSNGISKQKTLINLQQINHTLKYTEKVILDMPPFADSMMAFSVLSREHLLLPLSPTYLPEVVLNKEDLTPDTTWVTSAQCVSLFQTARQVATNSSPATTEYAVFKDALFLGGYLFDTNNQACMLGRALSVESGLGDPTPIGRRSSGQHVSFRLSLPAAVQTQNLLLKFKLHPLKTAPSQRGSHVIVVYVNHEKSLETVMNKTGVVALMIEKYQQKSQPMHVTFELSSPFAFEAMTIEKG